MRLGLAATAAASLLLCAKGIQAQPAPSQPATPSSAVPAGTDPAPVPSGLDEVPQDGAAASPDAGSDPTGIAELHPTAAPPPPPTKSDQPPPEVYIPFASDTLAGQFQVGVSGLFSVPFGELSRGVDAFPQIDVGYGPAVDLGIGISRHVVVGVYGEAAFHGAASACTDCSSTAFGAGAFVRYHLVQGLRFDPWIAYGIGYRGLTTQSASNPTAERAGLEWLRVQFGGDWYALRQLGFGPFVELGASSFFDSPSGETTGGVNWRFQSGLRLLLDLPGR